MKIIITLAFIGVALYCLTLASTIGAAISVWLAPLQNVFHV